MSEPTPLAEPQQRTAFLSWYHEALRPIFFLSPRWERLRASPAALAWLVLIVLLCDLAFAYREVGPNGYFKWEEISYGWLPIVLLLWACYLSASSAGNSIEPAALATQATHASSQRHASTAQRIGLILAMSAWFMLIERLLQTFMSGSSAATFAGLPLLATIALWNGAQLWQLAAQLRLLLRGAARAFATRALLALTLLLATLVSLLMPSDPLWLAHDDTDSYLQARRLVLTQEIIETQSIQLTKRLQNLGPQQDGVTDLYAITFAPFATEDVFKNESAMVSEVMHTRFGAKGLEMVNHVDTVRTWPWATPLNLKRAIDHVARTMNTEEDVFFLHLTSHGARNGELAAYFQPLHVAPLTPQRLKQWLDDAGIKHRVLSISACYSGSWIAPLQDDHTLIMTAADADNTSYGCGRGSDLTFFGRAMFDEQLRTETASFEEAHANAREIIKQREEEAGKSDGYSNPQIQVGAAIRPILERLQQSANHTEATAQTSKQ